MNRFLVHWSSKDQRWIATSVLSGKSYQFNDWNERIERALFDQDAPNTDPTPPVCGITDDPPQEELLEEPDTIPDLRPIGGLIDSGFLEEIPLTIRSTV